MIRGNAPYHPCIRHYCHGNAHLYSPRLLSQQTDPVAASAYSTDGTRRIRAAPNASYGSGRIGSPANSADRAWGIWSPANSADRAWGIWSPANASYGSGRIWSYSSTGVHIATSFIKVYC
jgi:hypothetical protein